MTIPLCNECHVYLPYHNRHCSHFAAQEEVLAAEEAKWTDAESDEARKAWGIGGTVPRPEWNEPPNRKQVGGDHYKALTIQPWDAMEAWLTRDEFLGFLKGNAIKYLARERSKGGVEDVMKAAHYIEKYISVVKG
jgi:hypothetical protein